MEINSRLLRAAICFQANHDVRYYLNGICISRKYIYATNGSAAIRMEHGKAFRADAVVRFAHKIPKSAHVTRIYLLGKQSYAEHIDINGRIAAIGSIDIIDGTNYPSVSVDKIIDCATEKTSGTKFPAIDVRLINIVCKAFRRAGLEQAPLAFKIPKSPFEPVICFLSSEFKNKELGEPQIALMPMIMWSNDGYPEN